MRLIDADRLLSDAMKTKYYHLPNGDVAIPLIDIEHAPTVGEWISVKDRLPPKNDKRVLTYGNPVTHWMPLPEPPKEVKHHEID